MGCENLKRLKTIANVDLSIRSDIIQTIASEATATLDDFHRMNVEERRRAACSSLESYVLLVRHAIQAQSHQLTEPDRTKALAICDLTIEWLQSDECIQHDIDIDWLNAKILDILHIFQPILKKLFKRRNVIDCGQQAAGHMITFDTDQSACH